MKRSMIAWLSGTSLVALAALGLGIAALVLTLDNDEPAPSLASSTFGRFDVPAGPALSPSRSDSNGQLGLQVQQDDDGLVVSGIVPGSPVDEAGLKLGDRLLALDGTELESAADAADAIATIEPGSSAELKYDRDGEPRSVQIEPRALGTFGADPSLRPLDIPLNDLRQRIGPRLDGLLPDFEGDLDVQVVAGQLASIDVATVDVDLPRGTEQFEIDDQTRLLPNADALSVGDSVVVIASNGVARVVWRAGGLDAASLS